MRGERPPEGVAPEPAPPAGALAPFRDPPAPAPEILALLATAVQAIGPRPVTGATDDADPAHSVWRFSGRWWNKPMPMRRERPFTGG